MFSSFCKQHLFKNVIKAVNANNNNIGLLNAGFLPISIIEKYSSTYLPNVLKKNINGINENDSENKNNTISAASIYKQMGHDQGKVPLRKAFR